MRIKASVTSVSWIPSEAVTGMNKGAFESGFTHYDDPPPDHIEDLDALRDADGFRFANRLAAWIEVEDGRITDARYAGGGLMGATTIKLGPRPRRSRPCRSTTSRPIPCGSETRFDSSRPPVAAPRFRRRAT